MDEATTAFDGSIPQNAVAQNVAVPGDDGTGQGFEQTPEEQLEFGDLGDEAQRALEDLLFSVGDDPNSAVEVDVSGSPRAVIDTDSVTTRTTIGKIGISFDYEVSWDELIRDPEILRDRVPDLSIRLGIPIGPFGSKPAYKIELGAGSPEEVADSVSLGLAKGVEVGGNRVVGAVRVNPGDSGLEIGLSGTFKRTVGSAANPDRFTAPASIGNGNGLWHLREAFNNGSLDEVLTPELVDALVTPLNALPTNKAEFIAAVSASSSLSSKNQIGVKWKASGEVEDFFLNTGEMASIVALEIPSDGRVGLYEIDETQYFDAALDDPFSGTDRLPDPLGEDAPVGDRSFASFLYRNYTRRGADHDEAMRRIGIDLSGGAGSFAGTVYDRLIEARPETITRQAFTDAGLGAIASFAAMSLAQELVEGGATQDEAWDEAARIASNIASDGGFEGDAKIYDALRTELRNRVDLEKFEERDLSDLPKMEAPFPLSDTVTGDLVVYELAGDELADELAAEAVDAAKGTPRSLDMADHVETALSRQDITLADGTRAIYVHTPDGSTFVVIRATEQAFSVKGSSVSEVEAMVLENRNGARDRLVSTVDPGITTDVVYVPQLARPEVATSGRRDPDTFGGDGLTYDGDPVTLADGSTGTLMTFRDAEGKPVEGYLEVRVGNEFYYFDRTLVAPKPHRSILIEQPDGGPPLMVQLDDLRGPGGTDDLGIYFADGTIRRLPLPNGGQAIYGEADDGTESVIYIAPGGQMRYLDVTDVADDTWMDLLEREGSPVLFEDVLVPRGAQGLEFSDDGGIGGIGATSPLPASLGLEDGDRLAVADLSVPQPPRPTTILTPTQQGFADREAALVEAGRSPEEASDLAYDEYLLAGGADGETYIANYIGASYGDATADLVDREDYDLITGVSLSQDSALYSAYLDGNVEAGAALEATGYTLTEGFASQALIQATTAGRDPEVIAQVEQLRSDGASEAEIEAALALSLGVPRDGDADEDADSPITLAALREETQAMIGVHEGLTGEGEDAGAGNGGALAFLQSFDLALDVFELADGPFEWTDIGAFAQNGSGNLTYFLEQIEVGNAAAWGALGNDLGRFAQTLSDDGLSALVDRATGLGVVGTLLTAAAGGGAGELPDDGLLVSGSLVSTVSNTLLAAAGKPVPGFNDALGQVPAPGLVAISGLGGLAGVFAARSEGKLDDIGADVLAEAPEIIDAFSGGDVLKSVPKLDGNGDVIPILDPDGFETGEIQMTTDIQQLDKFGKPVLDENGKAVTYQEVKVDGALYGIGLGITLGSTIAEHAIGGTAGRIIGGLGRAGGQTAIYLSGALNPVQLGVGVAKEVLHAIGVDIPPEAELAATAALAIAYASNPAGWVALAAQIVMQIIGMDSGTVVRTWDPAADADADGEFTDVVELESPWRKTFFSSLKFDDGHVVYNVDTVNTDFLAGPTKFELLPELQPEIRVDGDDDGRAKLIFTGIGEERPITIMGRIQERENGAFLFGSLGSDSLLPPKLQSLMDRWGLGIDLDRPIMLNEVEDGKFAVTDEWREAAIQQGLRISGTYAPINPGVAPEPFSFVQGVTPEEGAAIEAELGGASGTLERDDPLMAEGSEAFAAVGRVDHRFDGAKRDPNVYTYIDANGDGNPDLMRYGLSDDQGQGFHIGDARNEITLLGPNRQPLGLRDPETGFVQRGADGSPVYPLPTVKAPSEERAREVAALLPYLLQWAAARPELGRNGLDPVSIYNLVAEAGDLDAMRSLAGADIAAKQRDDVLNLLQQDPGGVAAEAGTDPDAATEMVGAIQAGEDADASQPALIESLGLFDVDAYLAANPYLAAAYAERPNRTAELAWHYLTVGNGAGLAVDAEGTVPDAAPDTPFPDVQSVGSELRAGEIMSWGEMLLSDNGRYATVFDREGDLKLYDTWHGSPTLLWTADNRGETTDDGFLILDESGNLVIRDDDDGTPVPGDIGFRTDTDDPMGDAHGDYSLQLGDDGVLRLQDDITGAVLWFAGPGSADNGGRGVEVQNADRWALGGPGAQVSQAGRAHMVEIMSTDRGALTYLASDPDRVRAFHAAGGENPIDFARAHFVGTGQFQEFDMDFDPDLYITAPGNDGLFLAFRDKPIGAIKDYIFEGLPAHDRGERAQLRLDGTDAPNATSAAWHEIMTTEIGALAYIAERPELIGHVHAQGLTEDEYVGFAREHFLEHGAGGYATVPYDAQTYQAQASIDGDLEREHGTDPVAVTEHYINFGYGEIQEGTRPQPEYA